ncbi:MAG: DNA-directed DNA polymerase II small subunit, partial [Candidatus Methanomethylicota archaeon]
EVINEKVRKAMEVIINSGFQLKPEALSLLMSLEDPEAFAKNLVTKLLGRAEKPLFIDEKVVVEAKSEVEEAKTRLVKHEPKAKVKVFAKQVEADIEVLYSPKEVSITSSLDAFKSYFNSRFRKLRKLLLERLDVKGAISIEEALATKDRKIKVIGIVTAKKELKSGNLAIELEDETASIKAIFMKNDEKVWRRGLRILLDEVICIEGVVRGDYIIVTDVMWPDIPADKKPPSYKLGEEPLYAVMISDLHVGSKAFLEKQFKRFLKWIRGEEGLGEDNIRPYVKYLIIAGDLVDGVGVYPEQAKELQISDIYKQYEVVYKLLSQVPDYIEIIIIPGNHDATSITLPSPPIFRSYAEKLYEMPNVHMLGDPCYVSLHGVVFLITHGKSLDDVIPSLPDVDFDEPERAMVELLKSRHIAPIYGDKTSIAPVPYDPLVIERIPDVMQAGHVHVRGVTSYRGVLVVNSGAWQGQTSYQRSMGLNPKPAVIPVVNLAKLSSSLSSACAFLDFTSGF